MREHGLALLAVLVMNVCVYNPMHASEDSRRCSILDELRNMHAVALVATKRRAESADTYHSFTKVGAFHVIDFGHHSGSQHSKHSGLSLALRADCFSTRNIVSIAAPRDDELRGRAAAVRVKQGNTDITFLLGHLPASFASNAQLYNRVLEYLKGVIYSLPVRTIPILLADANAHVGTVSSRAIGPWYPETENKPGAVFRVFLEDTKLVALNTYTDTAKTYYSINAASATRPDFIAAPYTVIGDHRLVWCKTLERSGDRLQPIKVNRPADHRPLAARIRLQLSFVCTHSEFKWDYDSLMTSLQSGSQPAAQFRADIRDWCDGAVSQFAELTDPAAHANTSQYYEYMIKHISDIAAKHFGAKKPAAERTLNPRLPLLRRRRTLISTWTRSTKREVGLAFQAWHVQTQLVKIGKEVKKMKIIQQTLRRDGLVNELKQAYKERNLRRSWHLARLISGTRRGPKKRRLNVLPDTRPSIEEWTDYVARPGHLGGCHARIAEPVQFNEKYNDGCTAWQPRKIDLDDAERDYSLTKLLTARSDRLATE
eukprot:TRINITY_DN28260_c0_g2_i1.p1 TRINITY_DN28260_c0_g2~~TRINITY_DN28260_c0_g2_i1.p1  ORF type:complete len:541 (+),score=33.54 TRINITY_DN28260_c0_g2_i1:83-1705(+)